MSKKEKTRLDVVNSKNQEQQGADTLGGMPVNEFVQSTNTYFTPNRYKGILQITNGNVTITQEKGGSLKFYGNNTTALFLYAVHLLAKTHNNRVEINLKDYALLCGYDVYNQDEKKAKQELDLFRKKYNKALRELDTLRLEWTETKGEARGDYDNRHIITGHGLRKGVAYIIINPDLAEPLQKNNYIMALPQEAFYIGKNAIQSKLLYKLAQHYNNAHNRKCGTNNRLSVKKLLEWTELPTVEELERQNNRHFDERILQPLENYLDGFVEDGTLLLWEYREPNLKKAETITGKHCIENNLIHFELPTNDTPTLEAYNKKHKEQ